MFSRPGGPATLLLIGLTLMALHEGFTADSGLPAYGVALATGSGAVALLRRTVRGELSNAYL